MTKTRIITIAALGLFLLSCDPDLKNDKYDRPEWLAGKVYTQLLAQPELSTFTRAIELTGYDTIIDRSGSYTVFAPNNDAFDAYFLEHAEYSTIEDIPKDDLNAMVKFHLVQNPWTKEQLRTLDVYGWIDTLDLNNNKPRGFKRPTLLEDENKKVGVEGYKKNSLKIVDTLDSDWHRMVSIDSRKFAPIFFREYFDIYSLNADDYSFYFERTIDDPLDIYYAGAKVIGDEVFAENGFVYEVDRVTEPLPNAYQVLEDQSSANSYKDFLDLINLFPLLEYNEEKTFDQPGADLGLEVDSLFDLSYPDLAFDILNERTSPPSGTFGLPNNVTIRYHHGIMAPTDEALEEFLNLYFVGTGRWGTLENAPDNIKRIIANTHMTTNTIYPTDFTAGIYNGESDWVTLDPQTIEEQIFGSNSAILGINSTLVPRVFITVPAPAYLLKGYYKSMLAIEQAGLLSALKREEERYLFYLESDANSSADSSLLYDATEERFSLYQRSQGGGQEYNLGTNDLRDLLRNHIAVGTPTGFSRKEFFRNLTGNYIIVDNETGEVRGTSPTTVGYQGLESKPNYPTEMGNGYENGHTYDIENYMSFTAPNLYQKIQSNYPMFHNLLLQAGLGNTFEYTFLSENEVYTVFAPTDSALMAAQVDTLDKESLQALLKLHFIQGSLIFTDGVEPPGYYETARIDEKSTTYTKILTKIFLDPGYDVITIGSTSGGSYVDVIESEDANIMTGRDVGEGNEVFRNLIISRVIHEIDKVLMIDEVDTQ